MTSLTFESIKLFVKSYFSLIVEVFDGFTTTNIVSVSIPGLFRVKR